MKKILTAFATIISIAILFIFFQNCGVQKPKIEDMSSLSSSFSHTPTPNTCISCHAETKPVVATTLQADRISNLYTHANLYNGDKDCVLCHTQNLDEIGITWRNGVFNHKTNLGVSVNSCLACHSGNKPVGLVGASLFDHATIGTKDCFECHKNMGANWSTTKFSHTPTPVSCSSCHTSTLPSATIYYPSDPAQPTKNLFSHSIQFNGAADCITCHINKVANVGVTWAGGFFNHKDNLGNTMTTCLNCHSGNKPIGNVGAILFNHSSIGTKDCSECHKNAGNSWALPTFSHSPVPTACNTCHNSIRPVATKYFPSDSSNPTINLFVHATQYNGGADCVSCHTNNPLNIGTTWSGGFFNHKTNTGVNVATCINCHTGNKPVGQVGASRFDHASIGTSDCVSCHTNAGNDWSSSGATAVPATVVLQPPAGTSLATITVKHPTVKAGMSCVTCHSNYNATNSIKGFDHAEGLVLASNNTTVANSCYYCHFSPSKVIDSKVLTNNGNRTFVNGKIVMKSSSHENLLSKSSCLGCHSATSVPTWSQGTNSWTTGGKWNGGD